MPKAKSIRIEIVCESCKKNFLAAPWEVKRGNVRFCSSSCYHKSQAIPLDVHFKNGLGSLDPNGCLIWIGIKDHHGYGIIYSSTHNRNQRTYLAHRVAWELANGPIEKHQCVLHRCDNPACVNIEHLSIGTQLDNIADMVSKNRSPNRKLTPQQVAEIRIRYASGNISQEELASEYLVQQTAISRIILRQTYRNVT